MVEPREDPLADELRELAGRLAVPPAPELGTAVRARLTAMPAAARRTATPSAAPRRAWSRRWRTLVAAVVAALLIAALPPARAAVASAVVSVLHFAGVGVERGPINIPATPSPLPSSGSVALDTARQRAHFPIRLPTTLGTPEDVQLADPAPDGAPRVVSLIYRHGTVRVDEFDGRLDLAFLKSEGVDGLRWVEIGTDGGLWLPRPHAIQYIDRDGMVHTETARLAGPTLIWTDNTVSYRIEGLSAEEAIDAAKSLA
jgi:hypothetical protein